MLRRLALNLWLLGLLCGMLPTGGFAQDTEDEEPAPSGTVEAQTDSTATRDSVPARPAGDDDNVAEAPASGQSDAEPTVAEAEVADDDEDGLIPPASVEIVPRGQEEPSVADSTAEGPRPDRPLFDVDEILRGLSITQGQPGFIPDAPADDLFHQPQTGTPRERYRSLLGESRLPEGQVRDVLGIQTADPSRDVPENFARVVVPDGSIEGSTEAKQFRIRGGVIIFYNDVEITAEEADIDERNEVAVLRQSVEVVDPKYEVRTEEMRIFFKDKKFEAEGFVQFRKVEEDGGAPDLSLPKKDRLREYFGKQRFELFANKLHYNWGTKELSAAEAVRLVHPSFDGTMERLDYNDESKSYAMHGAVELRVSDYGWIFANQLVDATDEKRVRAVTDQPTLIKADRVLYSDESGTAQFYALDGAQVSFDQSSRKITGNYIEINDSTKDFFVEGSEAAPASFYQVNGEWLYNAELINRETASEEIQGMLGAPLTATARTLTYNYDRKRLELTDDVLIQGATQSLSASEVVQDETAKFFLVRGNVVMKPDADTEIYASQVYVDTENDVFTFVGLVEGKTKSEDLAGLTPGPDTAGGAAGDPDFQGRPGLFSEQPASGTINAR